MYFQQAQQIESLIALYESGNEVESTPQEAAAWQLVNQVSDALIKGQAPMNIKQVQHVLFVKQMLHAGEIDTAEYFRKMEALFPERMQALDGDLHAQIELALAVSR